MVCFLACFGTCKGQKHRNLASLTPSTDQSTHGVATEPPKQDDIEEPISLISESKVPLEEPTNCGDRKKVTFDLNVKTYCEDEYEDIDLVESDFADDEEGEGGDNQTSVQEESSESMFSLSIDSRKHVSANETGEKEVNSPMPVHASSDKELKTIGLSAQDNWAVQAKALTTIKYQEKENINLEPYFNIATSPEKENTNLEPHFNRETSPEPSFKQSKRSLKPEFRDLKSAEHEVAVDTSLSSWLVESETTPKSSNSTNSVRNAPSEKLNSPRSHEDRPILGALTIEELRQYSASASPRWSRSRSPDDTPIIGTVGSYWSHTGQTMDSGSGSSGRGFTNTGSKKREDERMKWNSNPFEERLERV
nr:protein jason [Quercus suber]